MKSAVDSLNCCSIYAPSVVNVFSGTANGFECEQICGSLLLKKLLLQERFSLSEISLRKFHCETLKTKILQQNELENKTSILIIGKHALCWQKVLD